MSDDHCRSSEQSTPTSTPHVRVLGSFGLRAGDRAVPLPVDSRRLVAYLAVHRRPQPTAALAATLWPGVGPVPAARLLDEAVAGVDVPGLLDADHLGRLQLGDDVVVDLTEAMLLIRGLSAPSMLRTVREKCAESAKFAVWAASVRLLPRSTMASARRRRRQSTKRRMERPT